MRTLIISSLTLLFALPAIAKTPAKRAPANRAPAKRAKAKSPAKVPGVVLSQITMLKAGKGTKKLLRYKIAAFKGVKMRVLTKMLMHLKMRVGKTLRRSPPIPTPGLQVETTLHSSGTAKNGRTHIHGTITGIKVLPSVKTPARTIIQLRRALGRLKGMKMTYVFDDQGRLRRGGFRAPKGSGQQIRQILNNLKQNMQQIIVPLPTTPIGIGGSWSSKTQVRKPVKLTETSTYTLKRTAQGRLFISSVMRQVASRQIIHSQSPYGPVKNQIHYLRTKATGTSQVDLKKIFIQTKTKGLSNMKITVTVRKRARTITFQMDMTNSITAGK